MSRDDPVTLDAWARVTYIALRLKGSLLARLDAFYPSNWNTYSVYHANITSTRAACLGNSHDDIYRLYNITFTEFMANETLTIFTYKTNVFITAILSQPFGRTTSLTSLISVLYRSMGQHNPTRDFQTAVRSHKYPLQR